MRYAPIVFVCAMTALNALQVKDVVFEMSKGKFIDCFDRNPNRNLHRTILAYVNQMFQQISGKSSCFVLGKNKALANRHFLGINIITYVNP